MSKTSSRQDALYRAEEVLDAAWDSSDSVARVAIARRALEISPICADAYVILASEAEPGSDREIDLWRSGVEAGELALGDAFFKEHEGEFWGFLESRPYMRARSGLAMALWRHGEKADAISHLQSLLRLNPNDNQGIRFILVAYCIEADLDDKADVVLKEFAEDTGAFLEWSRALLAFRREGDTNEAREALLRARDSNRIVVDYLLGRKKLPKVFPDAYSLGDISEAVFYARDFQTGWTITPGALEWLRSIASAKYKKS